MRQPVLVKHPLRKAGIEFLAVFLAVVDREMLERGCELEVARIITLDAGHKSDRHASGEKRIFAEAFVDSAPIRVAAEVDDRRTIDEALVFAFEIRILMPAVVNSARF